MKELDFDMERLDFNNVCELADIMDGHLQEMIKYGNEYPVVAAYVHYDVAKTLIEGLIWCGYSIAHSIELEDYETSHYDKEFYICLTEEGIDCEKTFAKGHYLAGLADIAFVHEDCNSKILKYTGSDVVYEFGFINKIDDVEDDSENNFIIKVDLDISEAQKSIERINNEIKEIQGKLDTISKEIGENKVVTEGKNEEDKSYNFSINKTDDNGYKSINFYSDNEINEIDYEAIRKAFDFWV